MAKTIVQLFTETVHRRMTDSPTGLMNDLNFCIGVLEQRGGDYQKLAREFTDRLNRHPIPVEDQTSALIATQRSGGEA